MAYIANQDEDQQAAQNVATNIFQSTQGQQQQAPGPQAIVPTGGGDQSTAISSGNGSGTQQKAPQMSNSASSSKEVVRRNENKAMSPINIGQTRQNITQAQTDLQNEANNFVAGQKDKVGAVSDDVIKNAIQKGGEDYSKLGQRLTQAPKYENFNQQTNTDYSSKINELSDSSLKNYFKQQGGPQATAGEAAFDAMLLNKNKQFKQDRSAAQLDAANLDRKAKEERDRADAQGRAAYEQLYGAESSRIKDAVRKQVDPIRQQAEAQAAAANAERQRMAGLSADEAIKTPGYMDWLYQAAEEARGQGQYGGALAGDAEAEGAYLRDALSHADSNKINFLNVNQAPVSASNFITPEQADMLRRGTGLLGDGGAIYNSSGPADPAYSFNKDAASAYIRSILDPRREGIQNARVEAERAYRESLKGATPVNDSGDIKTPAGDILKKGTEEYARWMTGVGPAEEISKNVDIPNAGLPELRDKASHEASKYDPTTW